MNTCISGVHKGGLSKGGFRNNSIMAYNISRILMYNKTTI